MEGRQVKKIAVPISASTEIERIASEYGVEVNYTKNSHAAMMVASNKPNVGFVGGTRGGFIYPDYFFAGGKLQLDISALPAGSYLLQAVTDKNIYSGKVIVGR